MLLTYAFREILDTLTATPLGDIFKKILVFVRTNYFFNCSRQFGMRITNHALYMSLFGSKVNKQFADLQFRP